MRLIKKSEQALLSEVKKIEELEVENIQADTKDIPETVVETQQEINPQISAPKYIPSYDNPIVKSVGNSGWQISEIWRDIRVDNFCEY